MLQSVLSDVTLSEKEFRHISDLIYKHCGINLHDGKKELVRARLAKRIRLKKLGSFTEYIDFAANDPTGEEFSIMVDSLSTNLTSFFRENQHFEFLKKEFLPKLIADRNKTGEKVIRAWSAGCSSGEEPYSLAITLLDSTQDLGNWDIKILATDISTKVLEKARKGIYAADRVEPVSLEQKRKYLTTEKVNRETLYKTSRQLKDAIYFGHLNLMSEWPIKVPLDFIFCRNVMIYFDKPTQEKLVNRYWDVLQPGGMLFTGHSESLTGIQHKFKYVKPTIYAKA